MGPFQGVHVLCSFTYWFLSNISNSFIVLAADSLVSLADIFLWIIGMSSIVSLCIASLLPALAAVLA